jgi:hypothetical protein
MICYVEIHTDDVQYNFISIQSWPSEKSSR